MGIKMLTLMLLTLSCVDTSKPFASYQIILMLPSGSSVFSSSSSSNYSYPVPNTTVGKAVSLALSGYEMSSYMLVGFDATWQAGGAQVDINFQVSTNVTFALVKYNILVVNQSLQVLWLISGSNSPAYIGYDCVSINSQTSSGGHQYFNVSTPNSLLNCEIYPILIGFTIGAGGSDFLVCGVYFSRTYGTNIVELFAAKSTLTQSIVRVSYSLLIHNVAAFELAKHSYYYSSVVTNLNNLFHTLPLHLGIPAMLAYSPPSNFDQNCAISITDLFFQKQLIPWQVHFDTTDLTAANFIENIPVGATIFNTRYLISCYGGECSLGTYFDWLNVQCNSCPSGCADCLNPSYCLNCTTNQYYLRMNTCVSCSLVISNCLTCQADISLNQTNCTSCAIPYFLNAIGQCEDCALFFGNCSKCTNISICIDCSNSSFAFIPAQNSCLLCWQLFPYCLQCTESSCTLCGSPRVPVNGICRCAIGQQIAGLCTTVTGCILPSNSISTCLACNEAFFLESGLCKCLQGILANGICNTIIGCLVPIQVANDTINCQSCDGKAFFDSEPDQSGLCVCQDKYEMKNGACSEICGDGFLVTNSTTNCDDGNTVNGDGCSSACTTQVGYKCENGSSSAPSICFYAKGPINLSLQSIKRTKGLNQGVFYFEISPSLPQLTPVTISNVASLNCKLAQSAYSVVGIDYSGGSLSFTVNFSEDLQGQMCNVTLSYRLISPRYQASYLQFHAVSSNEPLLVFNNLGSYSSNQTIFKILSYSSLVLFLLSLGHKLIGAELIFCCQVVCLTNYLYPMPSFFFGPVKEFGLVTGWTLLHTEADRQFFAPFSQRINLTGSLFKNNLIVISTLTFVIILWGVIKVRSLATDNDSTQEETSKTENQYSLNNKATRLLYKIIVFPFTAGFLAVMMLAAFISNLRIQKGENLNLDRFLSSISMISSYLMMGLVASIQVSNYSTFIDYKGENEAKAWYIPCFLSRSVLFSMLFQAQIWLQVPGLVHWLGVAQILYLCLLIFVRPYTSILQNIGVLLCEFTTAYTIGLPFLQQIVSISEMTQMLLMVVLQGAIILCILLSAIRLGVVYYKYFSKQQISRTETINKNSSYKIENTKIETNEERKLFQTLGAKLISDNNVKKQNKQLMNESISINSKRVRQQQEEKAKDQQMLISLKQELRQQLRKYKQKYCRQSQIQ